MTMHDSMPHNFPLMPPKYPSKLRMELRIVISDSLKTYECNSSNY